MEGEFIVCISNTTWFGEYSKSTVQIMSRLALNNQVLFVEYPFTVKDIFTTLTGKQNAPVMRMLGLKKRLKILTAENGARIMHLVSPPVLPVDFIGNDNIYRFLFGINIWLYKRQITKILEKSGIRPVVITAYNPFYGLPLIGKLNGKLHVYYCYDGIGERRHGKRIYFTDRKFSESVDLIITTSDHLHQEKAKINKNSFVVKNGVDYDTFYSHAKKTVSPAEFTKTVGYIGSLDHRFDTDTVEYAIKNLPGMNFEFTGNLRNPEIKSRLGILPNVRFRPAVKPDEVPALLAGYDVGIIPYIRNEINRNIYPLKINEFLAVGVPVIMTAFARLPEFESIVSVAENKQDFVDKIRYETDHDAQARIHARIRIAASNSWDNKATEFAEILKNSLSKLCTL